MSEQVFTDPIDTIEKARAFYVAMGCNGYHMWKEYPDRWEEFRKLNIPRPLQEEWRLEEFERFRDLIQDAPDAARWTLFSAMVDLSDGSRAAFDDLLDVAKVLHRHISSSEQVIVAEIMLGSSALKQRDGVVLEADDLGHPDLARSFLDIVEQLLSDAMPDGKYITSQRIAGARGLMKETAELLKPRRLSPLKKLLQWAAVVSRSS